MYLYSTFKNTHHFKADLHLQLYCDVSNALVLFRAGRYKMMIQFTLQTQQVIPCKQIFCILCPVYTTYCTNSKTSMLACYSEHSICFCVTRGELEWVCVFMYKGEAESVLFAGLGKVNPGFSLYRKPLISANENCRPY